MTVNEFLEKHRQIRPLDHWAAYQMLKERVEMNRKSFKARSETPYGQNPMHYWDKEIAEWQFLECVLEIIESGMLINEHGLEWELPPTS